MSNMMRWRKQDKVFLLNLVPLSRDSKYSAFTSTFSLGRIIQQMPSCTAPPTGRVRKLRQWLPIVGWYPAGIIHITWQQHVDTLHQVQWFLQPLPAGILQARGDWLSKKKKKKMLATNFKRDALKRLSVPEFWRVGRKHPEDVATGLRSPAWWRWRSPRPSSDDTLPVLETWQGTLQAQDTLALVSVHSFRKTVCVCIWYNWFCACRENESLFPQRGQATTGWR